MDSDKIVEEIVKKKEFSQLPKKDIEIALRKFDNEKYLVEEKIKLTRNLLRKVFSAFTSQKLLNLRDKDAVWILKKHFSTRERLENYREVYERLLKDFKGEKISVIDLGAGVNGFSYNYFDSIGVDVNYIGVEAIGQLVNLMNYYFKKNKLNGKAYHLSLFDLDNVKKLVEKQKRPRVIFLFKTIDSLEMMERDYSKKLLLELSKIPELKIVISFATQSMIKRTKFKVKRFWILNFLKENFKILEDFDVGGERFIVFEK